MKSQRIQVQAQAPVVRGEQHKQHQMGSLLPDPEAGQDIEQNLVLVLWQEPLGTPLPP